MKRCGILMVAAASCLLALQRESRFGNVTFRLPQGWRAMEQGGRLAVMPGDLPPGQELFVVLMPSQALSGDLRAQFDAWVKSLAPRDKPADPSPVRRDVNSGRETLMQVVSLGSGEAREVWMFTGFEIGGRFESHVIVLNPAGLFQRYDPDVRAFMASLAYQQGSPAPSTAPAPSRLRELAPEAAAPSGYAAPGGPQTVAAVSDALPSLPPLQPRPGYAMGRVVDARGRPLENAEVHITRVFIQTGLYTPGYESHGSFRPRNGFYEVPLPPGSFRVTAMARVERDGQSYSIELQPLDGRDARETLVSQTGIVRDFVLATSGLRAGYQPDRWGTSNIGGSLQVHESFGLPSGLVAEVTLTPIGPGLDGGPARLIQRRDRMVFMITDIPLGKYLVSVTVNGRPRDFELRDSDNNSHGRGPLVFQPNDAGVAGVKRMRLLVR